MVRAVDVIVEETPEGAGQDNVDEHDEAGTILTVKKSGVLVIQRGDDSNL